MRPEVTEISIKNSPPVYQAVGRNDHAFWEFDLTGWSAGRIKRVFQWRGSGVQYSLGSDRLLQKYLEEVRYEAELIVSPIFIQSQGRHARRIERITVWSLEDCGALHDIWRRDERHNQLVGLGSIGFAQISVEAVAAHVKQRLEALGKVTSEEKRLTISESSQGVWNGLSCNMRGVIHDWMTKPNKGPVFWPEQHPGGTGRTGCRLSESDQVVVGLLYGMFSFGVKHEAVRGDIALEFQERTSRVQ